MKLSANSRPPVSKRFALALGADEIRSVSTMKLTEAAHSVQMRQLALVRTVRRSRVLPDPLFELSCNIEGRQADLMQKDAEEEKLAGSACDSVPLAAGIKFVEIDDRGRQACFTGMDQGEITGGFSLVRAITALMPAGRASVRLSDGSEVLVSSRSDVRPTDYRRPRNDRCARIPAGVGWVFHRLIHRQPRSVSGRRPAASIVVFCLRQAGGYSSAQWLNGCL